MAQNVSTAVMQRRVEAHDSLDDFPTPPWASRALIEHVIAPGLNSRLDEQTVWEPACNRGFMARPLTEYFGRVHASDIHDYGWAGQEAVEDFLWPGTGPVAAADWVITNPPFRLAEQFIQKSFLQARVGAAMFARTSFVEGEGRYRRLFNLTPPTMVAHFVERVVVVKGRILDPDVKIPVLNGATGKTVLKKPSSATSYSWLVWISGEAPKPTVWIPPCRQQLTRPGDYDG